MNNAAQIELSNNYKQQQTVNNQTKKNSLEVMNMKEKNIPSTSKGKSVTKLLPDFEKKSMKSSTKPWLNEDGTRKSDKEISELGKNWSSKMWTEYLDYDLGELDDDLSFFNDMDTEKVYERSEVLNLLNKCEYYESIENCLLLAIMNLSKLEKEIIKYSFWRMKSDEEVAKILKSTHISIRANKSKAIKKLGEAIASKELKNKIKILKKNQRFKRIIKQQKQWLNRK